MRVDFGRLISELSDNDNFLILTHRSPDGDTLGSAYALENILRKAGKTAYVKNCDSVPDKYMFLAKNSKPIPEGYMPSVIATVDVADAKLLGDLFFEYGGKVDICIDHHISNSDYARINYVDDSAAATGEIIFDIAKALDVELDLDAAVALYTSIVTDTGVFHYSNTTPRTLATAGELISHGFDFTMLLRNLMFLKTLDQLKLEELVLGTIKMYDDDMIAVIYVTQEMMDSTRTSTEDLEGIAQIPRHIKGSKVGITLKQSGEATWRISLRSSGLFDASAACKAHGGGGHPRAAGCEIEGTLSMATEAILNTVRQFLNGADE